MPPIRQSPSQTSTNHKPAKQDKHSVEGTRLFWCISMPPPSQEEIHDVAEPFDQHRPHQLRFSKISRSWKGHAGLISYSMYISNLDLTWRILFKHLHLKGTILIFEVGPELRWIDFFFFLVPPFFFPSLWLLCYSARDFFFFFFFLKELNKGRKYSNLSVKSTTRYGIIYWKGYTDIPIDVKQKGGKQFSFHWSRCHLNINIYLSLFCVGSAWIIK